MCVVVAPEVVMLVDLASATDAHVNMCTSSSTDEYTNQLTMVETFKKAQRSTCTYLQYVKQQYISTTDNSCWEIQFDT